MFHSCSAALSGSSSSKFNTSQNRVAAANDANKIDAVASIKGDFIILRSFSSPKVFSS